MAKPNIGQYENPVSGAKGNVFDVKQWFQMMLGVMVLLISVGFGEKIYQAVMSRSPIQAPITDPVLRPAQPKPSEDFVTV